MSQPGARSGPAVNLLKSCSRALLGPEDASVGGEILLNSGHRNRISRRSIDTQDDPWPHPSSLGRRSLPVAAAGRAAARPILDRSGRHRAAPESPRADRCPCSDSVPSAHSSFRPVPAVQCSAPVRQPPAPRCCGSGTEQETAVHVSRSVRAAAPMRPGPAGWVPGAGARVTSATLGPRPQHVHRPGPIRSRRRSRRSPHVARHRG
jgi:hypothetical protein